MFVKRLHNTGHSIAASGLNVKDSPHKVKGNGTGSEIIPDGRPHLPTRCSLPL
jgi:hypothetical protein